MPLCAPVNSATIEPTTQSVAAPRTPANRYGIDVGSRSCRKTAALDAVNDLHQLHSHMSSQWRRTRRAASNQARIASAPGQEPSRLRVPHLKVCARAADTTDSIRSRERTPGFDTDPTGLRPPRLTRPLPKTKRSIMRRPRFISLSRAIAASVACLLALSIAAPASAAPTPVTITITGGSLEITVPAGPVVLGTIVNTVDGGTVSGQLGVVQVSDARSAAAGSGWVASAISTAFTPPAGPAIAASAVATPPAPSPRSVRPPTPRTIQPTSPASARS